MFPEDDRPALLTRENETFDEIMIPAANAISDNGL
jgi:hypothetical protein